MDRQAGDGEDEPVEVPSNQLPEPPSRYYLIWFFMYCSAEQMLKI